MNFSSTAKYIILVASIPLLLLQNENSNAETPDAAQIASKMCNSCHADKGVGSGPLFPVLAGQRAAYLAKQLRDFRSGSRQDPTMQALALQLTDEDIDALAEFYASHRDALCF